MSNITPMFHSVDELNANVELFHDRDRPPIENDGPFVVVADDFYPDPSAVRKLALSQQFFQYKPPLAEQVGERVSSSFSDSRPVWLSSSLLRFRGQLVRHPKAGYRYGPDAVIHALSKIVGQTINTQTWSESGDWWNGAFHLHFEAGDDAQPLVHHHFREGDVAPRGWSGLVYLAPDAPKSAGTTIWREKHTGLCIAPKGNRYDKDISCFDLALTIENRFNRLVLFRENVLHRSGPGFGTTPEDARLTQTFFFHTI